ncbi:NAD(P)-binding protein [Mycena sanguinolenta]|uniref:NAD(P)-binding protein n=1 Tax=Mycena sanguinolenta TaxID=230812 RepID=A0A8H7CQL0_9AGAR|nr:NAD(P)-binding protein [Mycena sanguinolenta]
MAHPNFLLNSSTLVIGGSSGIGFAVASAALSNGSKVHITSVTPEKLTAKVSQLQSLYTNAHVKGSVADLSSTETLEIILQAVLDAAVTETGGPLDHIVYTAGEAVIGKTTLAELTAETALQPLTVRYLGPLLVGKLVSVNPGKYLKAAHTSSITLTSGSLAHRPRPGLSPVIGVAGAVEVLTRALAVDLAPIRVNVVIPGVVNTELVQKLIEENADVLNVFKRASLTKELGTPEGTAEAYLFCMRSTLATGQGFEIDNGSSLVYH